MYLVLLVTLVSVGGIAIAVTIHAIVTARDGFEDDSGFHFDTYRPDRPQSSPVPRLELPDNPLLF